MFKKKPWLLLFSIVQVEISLLARTLARPIDQEEDKGDDDHGDDDDEDDDGVYKYEDDDHDDTAADEDEEGRDNWVAFERGS